MNTVVQGSFVSKHGKKMSKYFINDKLSSDAKGLFERILEAIEDKNSPYSDDTLGYFYEAGYTSERSQEMLSAVASLLDGKITEEEFLSAWKKEVRKPYVEHMLEMLEENGVQVPDENSTNLSIRDQIAFEILKAAISFKGLDDPQTLINSCYEVADAFLNNE